MLNEKAGTAGRINALRHRWQAGVIVALSTAFACPSVSAYAQGKLEARYTASLAGIPLGSQTVLLKGVNDDVATLTKLFHALLKIRVRPYYLYQCDPISGSSHFRTSVDKGLELIAQMRGYTTGYAVPNYVVDAPGGGGKIAMLPDAVIGRDGDDLLLRNFRGVECRYPDPGGTLGKNPGNNRRNNPGNNQ